MSTAAPQTALRAVVRDAIAALPTRAAYARDVIAGAQRWSGADLQGKAKRYGAGYAKQRRRAYRALDEAGGLVLSVQNGRLVTAVEVGQDDHGNAVYATLRGPAVQHTARQARVLSRR